MIYFLANGIVIDSFAVIDGERGQQFSKFYSFLNDGYYPVQLAASTKQPDNDTTLSVLSEVKWLYSGTLLTSYTENFNDTENIFTPFGWNITNAGGELPAEFINDSLPNFPYKAGIDSWFVLPPVTISADAHTLEFTHIALVASGDSATVEVSNNDGVSYTPIAQYDKTSHPANWGNSLADSKPVHEILGLNNLIGLDAIIRFRLRTHSSGGDGWFIDSIQFTNTLGVSSPNPGSGFRAGLSANPLRIGSSASMKLFSDKPMTLTINIYSVLGKKEGAILSNKLIQAGDYELEFSPAEAGCYFFEVIALSEHGEERVYGKYIVLP